MTGRDLVLSRIQQALSDTPREQDIPRDYAEEHAKLDAGQTDDLLAENLADYRAHVHRCRPDQLPDLIRRLLAQRGARTVLVPDGVPRHLLSGTDAELVQDEAGRSAHDLDAVDSVVTGCAVAIAETGTLVLDAGPDQGSRRATLVPDHHICLVRTPDQVVASVPQALERLDPTRPLTWISGPSATSDIELDRVEGVHGPRRLDVILVGRP